MQAELAVLGAGPGGYAAAFRAADLGLSVTLIDPRPRLGGVCLQEGCIPSKALLHATDTLELAREAEGWGLTFQPPKIDLDALRAHKDGVIDKLTGGLAQLASARSVQVIRGRGELTGPHELRICGGEEDDRTLSFEKLILATGSQPLIPPPLRIDSERLMTSQQALDLPEVPETLLVVGGGYIGLELGTVYARLGSRVTVVEMLDEMLSGIDRDLRKPLSDRLDGLFEAICPSTRVESLREGDEGLEAEFSGENAPERKDFSRVLIAAGRRPASGPLGLDAAGVQCDERGFVRVDGSQRTTRGHIYAIGDLAGGALLAHVAFHEGYVAAEHAAGRPAAFDRRAIPAVIFTDPQIAAAGLSEIEARRRDIQVETARYPWSASGRALAMGRGEGLTKLLFEPGSGRLLGAGIVGADAGELIGEAALAIETGCTVHDIAETIHPHPTLCETVGGAAEVQLGLATEVYRRRK